MALGEYIGAGSSVTKGLWHLNGNSNDDSGNGNNGSDTDITYSNDYGKFGQGASFNGSSSKITLAQSTTLDLHMWSHTISAWIYLNGSGQYILFGKGSYAANKTQWKTRIQVSTRKIEHFITHSADTGIDYFITTGGLSLYTWYYLTLIYDKSARNISCYINGFPFAGTFTPVSSFTSAAESINAYIGCEPNGTSNWFNGYLDEIIFENRIWTAVEIQKYYTMAKGRFGNL